MDAGCGPGGTGVTPRTRLFPPALGDLRDLTGPLPYVALKGTKTSAARQDVSIYPDALPIILRRTAGKARGAYLLDQLKTPPEGSAMERGQPLTKEFGRLRKRLGIDEREDGARQANVDLHSLRRWFIAKARDAINEGATGFTMYTVAEVVGHQKDDLGLAMTSQYAGQESLGAKSAWNPNIVPLEGNRAWDVWDQPPPQLPDVTIAFRLFFPTSELAVRLEQRQPDQWREVVFIEPAPPGNGKLTALTLFVTNGDVEPKHDFEPSFRLASLAIGHDMHAQLVAHGEP